MLAGLGAGAALSSPGSAQPATAPIEIVSATTAGGPVAPDNVGPQVSDDGSIVVFDSSTTIDDPSQTTSTQPASSSTVPSQPTGVVAIRDRQTDTTVDAPDAPSLHPGISGDGCVIAYSVPVSAGQVDLTVLYRCDAIGGPLVGSTEVIQTVTIPTVTGTAALPAPALSVDGSVIVWSTGGAVTRYVDDGSGYVAESIPLPTSSVGAVVTGSAVDVSDDGNVVVFVAGPGTVDFEPTPPNVFVWTDTGGTVLASATAAGDPGSGGSSSPSVSGDGRIVAYESSSTDLAAAGASTAVTPFVVVLDRDDSSAAVLVDEATQPSISADGRAVVYDTATDVHITRWVGGDEPYANVSDGSLSIGIDGTSAGPSVTGPVVSRNGSLVVFDSENGPQLTSDTRFATGVHVWARATDAPPPTTTTTPTTSSPPVTSPPTTPPPGASTTAPPTSTGSVPSSTIPAATLPNRSTPPAPGTGSRPPSRTGSTGSGTRPVGTGSTPTFSTGTLEFVSFVPGGVEFSPTIVGAGRQSTVVTLSNPTSTPVTVSAISFEGDADEAFTVSDNACEAVSIPPFGSCSLTVSYAPITTGYASAQMVATLSTGDVAYLDLSGTGAPPPVLTVVPGVASSGQVVAIQGSGFPVGVSVELSWLGQEPTQSIEVDEVGSFVETELVMPHTPRGPATLSVFGQANLFDTVLGEVLITDTADRSSSALTQTPGSRFVS